MGSLYAKWHCFSCTRVSPDFYFLTQGPRLLGKMDPVALGCSHTWHISVSDKAQRSANSTHSWPALSWHQKRGTDSAVEEQMAGVSRHLTYMSTDALS